MELIKEHWTSKDGKEFEDYLLSLSKGKEKGEWEKRILNTKMDCIAVPSPIVRKIITDISKGNFIEFLDLGLWSNFTLTSITGGLICKIKDLDEQFKRLYSYACKADNWATVDCLKFNITSKNKEVFFNFAKSILYDTKPFVRRLAISILFKFVDDNNYIDEILKILNTYNGETEYYVNMINAWLFAECFTKQREKTLQFLQSHKLNKFTINKGISKCRDSFRISQEDKDMLTKFRQNNK